MPQSRPLTYKAATFESGSLISNQMEPTLSMPGPNILDRQLYTPKAICCEYHASARGILAVIGAFIVHAQGKPEVPDN